MKIYHVDAFADHVFSGNPAAVYPLENWLPNHQLQQMAIEHNLSETVFFIKKQNDYELRWFMPTGEVNFCGHGTLSAAFVIFNYCDHDSNSITFHTKKGILLAEKTDNGIRLDLPLIQPVPTPLSDSIANAFNHKPQAFFQAEKPLLVFEHAQMLRSICFDQGQLLAAKLPGFIVTAPGDDPDIDFMSRYFTVDIPRIEDPVTGSAHAVLTPYWAKRLNKTKLVAKQISSRGGKLYCQMKGDRVFITGKVALYFIGEVYNYDR